VQSWKQEAEIIRTDEGMQIELSDLDQANADSPSVET
jgi:hypothetical protein